MSEQHEAEVQITHIIIYLCRPNSLSCIACLLRFKRGNSLPDMKPTWESLLREQKVDLWQLPFSSLEQTFTKIFGLFCKNSARQKNPELFSLGSKLLFIKFYR